MFEESLLPHIEEQAERSKEVASIIVQADEDSLDSDDDSDKPNETSTINERKFRDLLRSKQTHVKESLQILR